MKKVKKVSFLVISFLIVLLLISCKTKTYSLENKSSYITINHPNLNKIKENESITLTISIPEEKVIDYLLINNDKITITTNTYSFTIKQNTVIDVIFKDVFSPNYFSLNLPKYVTANIDDLTNIYKGTTITLTINEPVKRVFDKLFINKEIITSLTNNTYTFNIKENTVVNVYFLFLDDWLNTSFVEKLNFGVNMLKTELIKPGTLEINLEVLNETNINNLSIVFNINKDKKILESLLETNEFSLYYDNKHSYFKIKEELEDELFYYLSSYFLINLNYYIDDNNSFTAFYVLYDVLENIIKNYTNEAFIDSIILLKKENKNKILAIINNDLLQNINSLEPYRELFMLLPEFNAILEIYFDNYELDYFTFELSLENTLIKGELTYTEKLIHKPDFTDECDFKDVKDYVYNIYLNDSNKISVTLNNYFVNEFINNIESFDILNKLNVEGLYLDKDFIYPLVINDLNNELLNIYIKWQVVQ